MSTKLRVVPCREQPGLAEKVSGMEAESFPAFIDDDPVWAEVSPHFYKEFADFQCFLIDDENGHLVGVNNRVPFTWDGDPDHLTGYQDMLTSALTDWRSGIKPNVLSGVQMIVDPAYRGLGALELLSAEGNRAAANYGITEMVSAIRPTLKEKYPLVSIEEYATWRRENGELFDPWMRAVENMGSVLVKAVPESTIIEASIAQWESWTDMQFPANGEYWIPQGLSTLQVDLEADRGRHCEPHVWFKSSIR